MSILEHAWGESSAADRVWAQFAGMRPSLVPDRRIMVLQAYIDDSRDTESGTYVIAGYVASAERWAAFSRAWEELLPMAVRNTKTGNFRFKMSEMARAGKMEVVALFHKIIMDHVEMSVSCTLNIHELKDRMERLSADITDPIWGRREIDIEPLKIKWGDPFFFAFRGLMDAFHREIVNRPEMFSVQGPVDFYFDKDEANESYIRAIWDEYLARREPEYREVYGRKPQFEDDEEFLPIQAADFRAWWIRKWTIELGSNWINGEYPFARGARKIKHLSLSVDGEQISRTVAESIGVAVQEVAARGLSPPTKVDPSIRFWPRDPL